MKRSVRILAIVANVMLILWMLGSAMTWGNGDWLGGTVVCIPPLLAIVALTWGQ